MGKSGRCFQGCNLVVEAGEQSHRQRILPTQGFAVANRHTNGSGRVFGSQQVFHYAVTSAGLKAKLGKVFVIDADATFGHRQQAVDG